MSAGIVPSYRLVISRRNQGDRQISTHSVMARANAEAAARERIEHEVQTLRDSMVAMVIAVVDAVLWSPADDRLGAERP